MLFEPRRRAHEAYRRRLWLHPQVNDWVATRGETEEQRRFFADTRAFLKRFVIGADFDDDSLLKPMSQGRGGVWSMRITFQPAHRMMGGFTRPGEFVVTAYRSREQLDRESFTPTLSRAKAVWESLFVTPRLTGFSRRELLVDFVQ